MDWFDSWALTLATFIPLVGAPSSWRSRGPRKA